MRLAAQIKLGYYPTPDRVVALIRERVTFPVRGFAALDPCAGDGSALAALCAGTNAAMYGVEPDLERARSARTKKINTLHSPLENAQISHRAFSIVLFNPPYDSTHNADRRLEVEFWRRVRPYCTPGAVVIVIVPEHVYLSYAHVFTFVRAEVWRFPEPEYSQFQQIVLVGQLPADGQRVLAEPAQILDAPPLDAPRYPVPTGNPVVPIYRTTWIDPDDLRTVVPGSPNWRRVCAPTTDERSQSRPPLALRAGHLGLLLATGCLDGIVEGHVVRGIVRKRNVTVEDTTTVTDAGTEISILRERDSYAVILRALTQNGEIVEIK